MPGIVGLVTTMPRQHAEAELRLMVEALRHEAFYVTGTCVDESLGLYLGWITPKDSFSDGMPLRNERENIVLVFSGEEFPEPGTARGLRARGHTLQMDGPNYLVHLAEEDPSFPVGLNGRFHGLLADRTGGTMTLFNDRYGMHRVYYHEAREAFYFAAEAKAILAVRPELRRTDARGFGEHVACGCVLENRTLFDGIYILPPASAWRFRTGSLERKGAYFQPREWEDQTRLDPETFYQELRSVFSRNLGRYFDGPRPLAMSLTGGLDGRMIMAWQKASAGSLPCYTFGDGTGIRQCRDAIVAQQVARGCKQSHEVIPVGEEFLSRFSHYAERAVYLTDGCLDLMHSPDLYLNEKARAIAPVRMTGNYGSEVLRRAVAFKPWLPTEGLFKPEVLRQVRSAEETYAGLLRGNPVSFAVFRQAPWHHYGLLALEQTQISLRTPYLDNDLVRTVFRAPESALLNNDACMRLIADGDAELRQILTDRGLNGSGWHFSTAAYRNFLEFTFKAEYAYDSGMPQWVARIDHLLSPLRLERLFLGWHKFHHFRVWYRDALSGYVREMLLDPRSLSRPYLEPQRVKAIVEGHIKGNRNYTFEIHKMLTLELFHRAFIDAK
jgi:asparagine synthase (glutamine-hydrolysing)